MRLPATAQMILYCVSESVKSNAADRGIRDWIGGFAMVELVVAADIGDRECGKERRGPMKRSLDKICIRQLTTECIIGINPQERETAQQVVLSLELYSDLTRPSQTDDIDDTVNYRTLKYKILEHIRQSRYYLLEKLAGSVAEICLAEPQIDAVKVTVDKPGALTHARSVAVELTRER